MYTSHIADIIARWHHIQFFAEMGLANFLPRLASNHELPSLYLSSSWDYRCEPP
jgi:hypothetical protein